MSAEIREVKGQATAVVRCRLGIMVPTLTNFHIFLRSDRCIICDTPLLRRWFLWRREDSIYHLEPVFISNSSIFDCYARFPGGVVSQFAGIHEGHSINW